MSIPHSLPHLRLAQQIQKFVVTLGDYMAVQVHSCVRGTAIRDDIRTLQGGFHVVIGICFSQPKASGNIQKFFFTT